MRQACVRFITLMGCAVALTATPGSAEAAGTGFRVTIAARSCPSYDAITANRARNNIQESLRDLGPDTTYVAGQPVDPDKEQADQPTCVPIPDWQFTLGSGYRSRAVSGHWGSLSVVTGVSGSPVTRARTPLLNAAGQDTGRTIAGAVTVELTPQQLDLAVRSNALWLQGGTPTDPVLDVPFPGQYGFGALRCSIDNLNGDNVEWIAFPQGATHVFCYAYYVQPPPTSGTIIVRKQVDAPAGTARESFPFDGNVSFTPDHSFTLPAGPGSTGEQVFYRAAGAEPWTFHENVPPGWTLTGLSCTSQTGTSSTIGTRATATTSVVLGPGDVVTCTYIDQLTPPAAGLLLRKITEGGVGTFGFDVEGEDATQHATATTTTPDEAVAAGPGPLTLTPGEHRITESSPDRRDGTWKLTDVACSGGEATGLQPTVLTVAPGAGAVCTFTNAFTPHGAIRLRKETLGAVGSAGFVVSPVRGTPPRELAQSATTRQQGIPVLATGDDTSALPLGAYVIQETAPSETADGAWSLESVVCDGEVMPSEQGEIRITLTAADPHADCRFVNRFTPGAEPPKPPDPGPDPSPESDLVLTKRALTPVVRVGGAARYLVTVTNRGDAPATAVTVTEQVQRKVSLISLRTDQGSCRRRPLPVCTVGTVLPGQTVRIRATVRTRRVGTFTNRVAAGTATAEASLRTSTSRARIAVRAARVGRFTG